MLTPDKSPVVTHWSTDTLAPEDRWAGLVDELGKAIVPLNVAIDKERDFHFHMSAAELSGGFSVLRQSGSAHRSYRGRLELARSGAHTFHFMINLSSAWTLEHAGPLCLKAGEGVLTDSNFAHDLNLPSRFEMVHLKMSEAWVRRWLAAPEDIVGKRIALDQGFGRSLNLYAAQLSPEMAVRAPLHYGLLADQFGALLAMVAAEKNQPCRHQLGHLRGFRDQVLVCMQQRISEPMLNVCDIAYELNVSSEAVLDALTACGQTFTGALNRMRTEVGLRMLRSPSFSSLSYGDIAQRAGFSDVFALQRAVGSIPSN
ncbi:hypothetical protein GTP46_08355 [Duganella sp. FT135W]|uniref:HTH araC/xylS-type domain-containing protein n=1 Tax=Duganella flavida TaxID=2692175 RepID=A0A6L8K5J5_9BURK|nr:hypothetical protein [Duganella flavida]MYM22656.1 hypothetical protein [Duganella flavida]